MILNNIFQLTSKVYTANKQFQVGSLRNKQDRDLAAQAVAAGDVVGIFNRGVCALWFDGGNPQTVEKVSEIKGEGRKGKAIALTLSLDEFIPMIDMDKLPAPVKNFLQTSDLKWRIGSLVFIRAPLKEKFQRFVPSHAKTIREDGLCMIQNWDSFGHNPSENFLKKVRELGVKHPSVTSMNLSDQPEIVDQKEAEKFCRDQEIPIFLKDPNAHPDHKGSYTIIALDRNGVTLTRDGNIPAWIIEQILGMKLIKDKAKKSNYPQLEFPKDLLEGLSPRQIRHTVLQYLNINA